MPQVFTQEYCRPSEVAHFLNEPFEFACLPMWRSVRVRKSQSEFPLFAKASDCRSELRSADKTERESGRNGLWSRQSVCSDKRFRSRCLLRLPIDACARTNAHKRAKCVSLKWETEEIGDGSSVQVRNTFVPFGCFLIGCKLPLLSCARCAAWVLPVNSLKKLEL